MTIVIFCAFVVFWTTGFIVQISQGDGSFISIREYGAALSNFKCKLPKWLSVLLFFNYKKCEMPLTVFVYQTINYFFLIICLTFRYALNCELLAKYIIIFKIWAIIGLLFIILMYVDFQIFIDKNDLHDMDYK